MVKDELIGVIFLRKYKILQLHFNHRQSNISSPQYFTGDPLNFPGRSVLTWIKTNFSARSSN